MRDQLPLSAVTSCHVAAVKTEVLRARVKTSTFPYAFAYGHAASSLRESQGLELGSVSKSGEN